MAAYGIAVGAAVFGSVFSAAGLGVCTAVWGDEELRDRACPLCCMSCFALVFILAGAGAAFGAGFLIISDLGLSDGDAAKVLGACTYAILIGLALMCMKSSIYRAVCMKRCVGHDVAAEPPVEQAVAAVAALQRQHQGVGQASQAPMPEVMAAIATVPGGQPMQFETADGRVMTVMVPMGVQPGMEFEFQVAAP